MKLRMTLCVAEDVREALQSHGARGYDSMSAMVEAAIRQHIAVGGAAMNTEDIKKLVAERVAAEMQFLAGHTRAELKREVFDSVVDQLKSLWPNTFGEPEDVMDACPWKVGDENAMPPAEVEEAPDLESEIENMGAEVEDETADSWRVS